MSPAIDDVTTSVDESPSYSASDDICDDNNNTQVAVENDQLIATIEQLDYDQPQPPHVIDAPNFEDHSEMLTDGTSPCTVDSNPITLPSERLFPVATYEPAWRPQVRSPTNGGSKTSLIGRILRRKQTIPDASRHGGGGGDGSRGRYYAQLSSQQRWELNSRGVNQPTSQYFPGGAAQSNYNVEVNHMQSNKHFHYDKNAALYGTNDLNSATTQQQQQQENRHVVKPISSHHAGHVAAKYFRKLDLEDEFQVFGYVREGDKIKPLVHRNYSGCNKVRDEVEACVVQCDGGTVAYHRWRGVHGILLHRGVSAVDDAWGSIDIGEHFATAVPPLQYQSPD